MINYTPAFLPDFTFHVYNRAINKEKLFVDSEHYFFFLRKYDRYISPIADTFCYCLMPNHFHILIRFKSEIELRKICKMNEGNLSKYISLQFSHLFNAYSKAFNKEQFRKGSLFMRPLKRKKIDNDNYFRKIVQYIHLNPVVAYLSEVRKGGSIHHIQVFCQMRIQG